MNELNTSEPVLTKREPHDWDYVEITWDRFLSLKDWAEKLASEVGYPVYLVGSALTKRCPRDIDVSVIMPHDKYVGMIGEVPPGETMLSVSFKKNIRHYFEGRQAFGYDIHGHVSFDLKFCSAEWFTDKPKMLIGEVGKG